jgi:hypothetical protein
MGNYGRSIATGKQSLRQAGAMTPAAGKSSEENILLTNDTESDINAGDRRRTS